MDCFVRGQEVAGEMSKPYFSPRVDYRVGFNTVLSVWYGLGDDLENFVERDVAWRKDWEILSQEKRTINGRDVMLVEYQSGVVGINAYWITFINPDSVLNTIITDQLVVMVLVGGLGHAWGPALGATAMFLLQEQLRVSYGETTAYIIVVGALVMAVVLFLPDGLVSIGQRARRMRLVRQLLGRARDDVVPQRKDAETEEATR